MNTTEYRFIEPLDVLFLRGNKLFGDPGSFGESLIPPWPSVAAGALRSRMLADDGIDLAAFARGEVVHPALGTPGNLGAFEVTAFHLARRNSNDRVEVLFAVPADLIISESDGDKPFVRLMSPVQPAEGLMSSAPFKMLPVLAGLERSKPVSGYWLTEAGWRNYLKGMIPAHIELVKSSDLWSLDHRVGVGLDAATRRSADGRLFSTQAIAMHQGVGFLAAVSGAVPPRTGTVRFGADGRAAAIRPVESLMPEPNYAEIVRAGCCRMILTSPGIFPDGWKLPGIETDNRVTWEGISARIVCAAVPRAETVSGWNLAKWQPKSAQRAVPAGSVYWLDELKASPEALRKLAESGLWSDSCEDSVRRVEGFNRIMFAV